MNAIAVILQKEWWELRRERSLLATLLFLPALITAIGLGTTYGLGRAPDDDTAMLGAATADPALAGLPTEQLGQVIMGRQFGLLLLLLPMVLPSLLAAYSIIGEKSRRTLEPLLATPVRDWELLLAKSLGAVIPPLLMTWACAAIYAAGIALVSLTPDVAGLIVTPAWTLMLAICSPLLALIAVAASVLISARVNDPRTAQNLSGVLVVPFMALFFGQLVGLVVPNLGFVLAFAAALAALAALAIWAAARLFARETILTRWR